MCEWYNIDNITFKIYILFNLYYILVSQTSRWYISHAWGFYLRKCIPRIIKTNWTKANANVQRINIAILNVDLYIYKLHRLIVRRPWDAVMKKLNVREIGLPFKLAHKIISDNIIQILTERECGWNGRKVAVNIQIMCWSQMCIHKLQPIEKRNS